METKKNKISIVIKIYKISRFFYIHNFCFVANIFYAINYLLFNCVIPPSVEMQKGCNIAHGVGIVIHHEAIIGKGTKIYQNVTIGGSAIHIGENCYIGSGAIVMADLGDNVKIGANAVVLHPVPSNCTAVGIPAKVVNQEEE